MASFTPPWLGQFALPRLTLLLNHVVSSEPVAMAKLKAHAGRTVDIHWETSFPPLPAFLGGRAPSGQKSSPWRFMITPAGLFEALDATVPVEDLATTSNISGLTITIHLPDPLTLARLTLKGERPEVNIEGDAALAEVASWMMKNLRWDVQDDLARWVGTAPAELLRAVGDNVRQTLQRWRPAGGHERTDGASHAWGASSRPSGPRY
jgi:ubiquinone biosynthesis protein UbiJ